MEEDNWWYGRRYVYNLTSEDNIMITDEHTDEIIGVYEADEYPHMRGAVAVEILERQR